MASSAVIAPASPTAPTRSAPATAVRAKALNLAVWMSTNDRAAAFSLAGQSEFGGPRVLLATALLGDWVKVSLPLRPNGSEGFVRARDVEAFEVHDAIVVDLGARTLRWMRDGELQLEATVAIGAPQSPTPPGDYYVTDLVRSTPGGALGAWVLALNGYSETFATFDGGDPRLAIHGTNDPASIGAAASNGCVRVAAGVLDQLAAGVPAGTPVTIR